MEEATGESQTVDRTISAATTSWNKFTFARLRKHQTEWRALCCTETTCWSTKVVGRSAVRCSSRPTCSAAATTITGIYCGTTCTSTCTTTSTVRSEFYLATTAGRGHHGVTPRTTERIAVLSDGHTKTSSAHCASQRGHRNGNFSSFNDTARTATATLIINFGSWPGASFAATATAAPKRRPHTGHTEYIKRGGAFISHVREHTGACDERGNELTWTSWSGGAGGSNSAGGSCGADTARGAVLCAASGTS